jgi:GDP/UDP-N,N'-diacetylbacillosamine 2-epimerase (hydrolysing)
LLDELKASKGIDLALIVSGTHLSQEFGLTYRDIEKDGFVCDEKVEMILSSDTPISICKSMGLGLIGFSEALIRLKPDFLVILGDRFESMSIATSAMVCRIPIAHIQGGEMTLGAIDDHVRHSITKMSYLHFVTTDEYFKRVVQLGENPKRVFNVGALNVDSMKKIKTLSQTDLEDEINFSFGRQSILVTFHPVTMEENVSKSYFKEVIAAIDSFDDLRIIFTYTNADAEGRVINSLIDLYVELNPEKSISFASLGQLKYISTLKYISAVVGNSSSGVIETPTFKVPTVNIGDREKGRIMAPNVICCEQNTISIRNAISKAISSDFKESIKGIVNPYDQADTAKMVTKVLEQFQIPETIKKTFFDLK